LRKRITFAAFFTILLAATIVVAVYAQAQTTQPNTDANNSNVVTYIDSGIVNLQVPNGSINHPLNLRILVTKVNETSDFGGPSVMQIYVWAPSLNQYVGAAILSTNTNQTAIDWILSVVNGTPIWTPPTMENYFVPTTDQLNVSLMENILWANLTTSFNVTLPDALGGNFTIPPMTLMFIPIANGFAHEEITMLPKPPFSGWTINASHTDVPAWVRVIIPMWVGNGPVESVGTLALNGTAIYIPPST